MSTSIFRDDPTLASRYLADQLSESERSAYESALAEDPEVLRELEATARLKVGLHRLRRSGELTEAPRVSRLSRPQFLVAMAAGLAAVVLGIGLWRSDLKTPGPPLLAATLATLTDATGRVLPLAQTEAAFRKRSGSFDAVFRLPPGRAAIELRVLPEAAASTGRYRLTLSRVTDDGTRAPVASISGLRTASDGFLEVFLDASRIPAGTYRLVTADEQAAPESGSEEALLIRVVPTASR
jgi:hypothetical protein